MPTKREVSIIHAHDPDGTSIVRVGLANHFKPATLFLKDFLEIQERGITSYWTLNSSGNGHLYVKAGMSIVKGNRVLIARIIARASEKQMVKYADGDSLNLRADNLLLRSCSWAKRDLPERLRLSGYGDDAAGATAVPPQLSMPQHRRRQCQSKRIFAAARQ